MLHLKSADNNTTLSNTGLTLFVDAWSIQRRDRQDMRGWRVVIRVPIAELSIGAFVPRAPHWVSSVMVCDAYSTSDLLCMWIEMTQYDISFYDCGDDLIRWLLSLNAVLDLPQFVSFLCLSENEKFSQGT